MIPSTLSRRVTTSHRVSSSSITRAAARRVVSGLTVATGEVMMSLTKTFDGFLPVDVTFHRISRSVTRPIGRPYLTTTRPPIFFAAIRFAASRTVRSGSMTMTLFVITSRTKTIPNPEGAAAPIGARYRSWLTRRASYHGMKASNARTAQPLRCRRSGGRQDLGPRFPLLPWEALSERIQPQSVLAGRIFRASEEGPSVPGATPHETAFRTNGAGPVVLPQERRVSDPTAERGSMRLQFRHDGVERTPRLGHHVLEGRLAFRNRRHAFLQMAGHLRTRDVGAIDGQGVHEGPSRGGRSHGAAGDELPAEEQIQDLMARRLRAKFEPLHREEEGPLRVERRGFGSVFDHPDLLDRDRLAFGKGRQLRHRLGLWEDLPPSRIEDFSPGREERRVPHGESHFCDGRHARGGERREESARDQVVHPRPDAVPPLRRSGGRGHPRRGRRVERGSGVCRRRVCQRAVTRGRASRM